ncbi:hypothetical protein LRP49_07555 [Enterovibrio sp. ZSDZ35]|uniref:Lipoprotein n=1 Tax=Enterovibrio qingdaonensis TaxID=2899818 RepID=A0ABT5QJ91_9GAMM|nr:hypothetical protein [Enterovibrio sp. ZSDZ35]MDD1781057.1 hypothetical protein [Enterovibrio sp. ZSDZ35]
MMKLKTMLLASTVAIGLSGCVIPTDRTYYKPEAGFGEAVASQSCGYQRTKLDALRRTFDGYRVQVEAEKDGRNGVTISVSATVENPELNINDVAFDNAKVTVVQPISQGGLITKYAFQHQSNGDIWLSRTFLLPDAPYEQVIEVQVQLAPGAIIMGDTVSEEMAFRFSLTTTFDVLYFSINC